MQVGFSCSGLKDWDVLDMTYARCTSSGPAALLHDVQVTEYFYWSVSCRCRCWPLPSAQHTDNAHEYLDRRQPAGLHLWQAHDGGPKSEQV